MGSYSFDFGPVLANWHSLADGLALTLWLTAAGGALGLVWGALLGFARCSRSRIISVPAALYIELFRCTPALVQLIWIFYCLPILLGVRLEPIPVAILALALNIAAFNAEALRAAIQGIPAAQREAASALGLGVPQTAVLVILPQAALAAAPVLVANLIGLMQQTALVSILAISDLLYAGRTLATASYRPIETMSVVALIYLILSFVLARLVDLLRRKAPVA